MENLIVPQSGTVLYGRWGTWKSMLMLDLMFKLSSGSPWVGFKTRKTTSAMVQIELPKYQMQLRINKYMAGNGIASPPGNIHIATESTFKLDIGPQYDLKSQIAALQPKLLIFDPLYQVLSRDINSNYEVQRLLDFLNEFKETHNLSVILIGHIRKPGEAQDPNAPNLEHELIGGSYTADWADNLISVHHFMNQEHAIQMTFEKHRFANENIPPRVFMVNRNTLTFNTMNIQRK